MDDEKLIFEVVVDDAAAAVKLAATKKELQELFKSREQLTQSRNRAKKQLQQAQKAESEAIVQKQKLRAEINRLKQAEGNNSEEIGRLTAQYVALSDQQNEASRASDKYAAELQQAESSLKEVRKEINLTQKDLQALPGSLAEQRVELSRLKKEYAEFTIGISGTEEELEALKKRINSITDDITEQEQGIQVFSRNVGNYKESVISAFNEMPGPVGRLTSSIKGLKDTFKQLKALGPSGLAIAGVAGIVAAGAAVGRYGVQLDDTREKIRQFSDESGEALTNLTAKTTATASTFKKESTEVAQATNSLFKAYEDTLDSQSDAGQLIRKSFAAGGDAAGDLLELFKEYPSRLEEAGLSADQAVALIAQQPKTGVFSDKGIDVIQESLFRIREMPQATKDAIDGIGLSSSELQKGLEEGSISAFEVVQKVSGKISELPPLSSKVGTAIADIFGGPGEEAGLKYISSLQTINLNLDELTENAGGAADANLRIADSTERINKQFLNLFEGSNSTFKELKADAIEFAADGLEFIIKNVVGLINYFIDLYNESGLIRGAFQLLGAVGKTVFTSLKNLASSFFSIFKNIGQVIGAVLKGEFSSIPDIIRQGAADRRKALEEAGAEIAESWKKAYQNTVKKDKVALISFGSDEVSQAERNAEETGKRLGKAFNEGFSSEGGKASTAKKKVQVEAVQNVSFSEINSTAIDLEELAKTNNERLATQRDYLVKRFEQQQLFLEKEKQELQVSEELTGEERLQRATEIENEIRETKKQILELQLADLQEGSAEALEIELQVIALRKEAKDQEAEEDQQRLEDAKALEAQRIRLARMGLQAVQDTTEGIIEAFGEQSTAGKVAIAIQKVAAATEIGLNLRSQISNALTAGAKIAVKNPVAGAAYQIASIAAYTVQATKLLAEVAGFEFGGFSDTDGTRLIVDENGEIKPAEQLRFEGNPVSRKRSFADGGFERKPTLAIVGERGTEYVVPAPVLKTPEGAAKVAELEEMRSNKIRAFESGGFTAAPGPSITIQNPEALKVYQRLMQIEQRLQQQLEIRDSDSRRTEILSSLQESLLQVKQEIIKVSSTERSESAEALQVASESVEMISLGVESIKDSRLLELQFRAFESRDSSSVERAELRSLQSSEKVNSPGSPDSPQGIKGNEREAFVIDSLLLADPEAASIIETLKEASSQAIRAEAIASNITVSVVPALGSLSERAANESPVRSIEAIRASASPGQVAPGIKQGFPASISGSTSVPVTPGALGTKIDNLSEALSSAKFVVQVQDIIEETAFFVSVENDASL